VKQQTQIVQDAINELLAFNQRTAGARVEELYLAHDWLVARLVKPKVIEGVWETVENKTADIFDLMDMHDAEAGR
jgi:hypothetical protein